MLIVLSPAKSLDYETPAPVSATQAPALMKHSKQLLEQLRRLDQDEIAQLMSISPALAQLNHERFAKFSQRFTDKNSKAAVFAFNGDVYEGLQANTLTMPQVDWIQQHVRILSGLYGVLMPLDRMQPYRLEMGTKLAGEHGKHLYDFWGTSITGVLNQALAEQGKDPVLVNLASDEYFKAVVPKHLQARIITPVFEEGKNGRYKIVSFFAKRARGLMTRYAAQHKLKSPEKLKGFDLEGYVFAADQSDDQRWVFRRHLAE